MKITYTMEEFGKWVGEWLAEDGIMPWGYKVSGIEVNGYPPREIEIEMGKVEKVKEVKDENNKDS
jgi:hypothetical protein